MGHVMLCLLIFSVVDQSACSVLDLVLKSQSDLDLVLYKLIGNFHYICYNPHANMPNCFATQTLEFVGNVFFCDETSLYLIYYVGFYMCTITQTKD